MQMLVQCACVCARVQVCRYGVCVCASASAWGVHACLQMCLCTGCVCMSVHMCKCLCMGYASMHEDMHTYASACAVWKHVCASASAQGMHACVCVEVLVHRHCMRVQVLTGVCTWPYTCMLIDVSGCKQLCMHAALMWLCKHSCTWVCMYPHVCACHCLQSL